MVEPPAFIRPLWYWLADVTDLFDWDALAAIGTVGALWFAVVQFSKGALVERARQIGTLTRLISSLYPITMIIASINTEDEFMAKADVGALVANRDLLKRLVELVNGLTPQEIADAGLSETIVELQRALRSLESIIPADAGYRVHTAILRSMAPRIIGAYNFCEERHGALKYGRVTLIFKRPRRRFVLPQP